MPRRRRLFFVSRQRNGCGYCKCMRHVITHAKTRLGKKERKGRKTRGVRNLDYLAEQWLHYCVERHRSLILLLSSFDCI